MDKKNITTGIAGLAVGAITVMGIGGTIAPDLPQTAQALKVNITPQTETVDELVITSTEDVVKFRGTNEDLNRDIEMAIEEKERCSTQWQNEIDRLNSIKSEYLKAK